MYAQQHQQPAAGARRTTHLVHQRPRDLDAVRHVKVVQAVLPRELLDNVRAQQVEARVQQRREALPVPDVDKVREQLLRHLRRRGRRRRDDRVLVQLVLLRQRDRLFPARVFLAVAVRRRAVKGRRMRCVPCRDAPPVVGTREARASPAAGRA